MGKKFVFSASVLLVLTLTCPGFALVIGDFEDGSMDGWVPAWGSTEVTLSLSEFGATSGNSSLSATVVSGGYWRLQLVTELSMTEATAVSIDVTFDPNEWTAEEGAWAQLDAIAIQPGWFQVGPTSIVNRDTGEEVEKAWGGAEEDSRRTYTWDITGKDWLGVTATEIFIAVQWASFSQGGAFYIDNIQVIGAQEPAPLGPKIIWVTDANIDRDVDGVQDDQQWINWLLAQNYDVDARPGYWMAIGGKDANDANDYVGELNAAALVILSRTASSGDYNQEGEPALWNSVTAPMIALSAYHLRNTRWFWINSGDVQRSNISFMEVLELDHPIFADVEIDPDGLVEPVDPEAYSADLGYQGICFVNSLDMGNGKLLAKSLAEMSWIAEWDAGVEFYADANAYAGGPRLMFAAGTQDSAGAVPQGAWNLTAAGEQMFLNAIEYMISLNPVPIEVENASFELPGTAKMKNWEEVPDWSSDTVATDSGVESAAPRFPPSDGEWSGFMKGADPSVWQLTNHVIQAGAEYILKVDAENNSGATQLLMSLYYDDGSGNRIVAASQTVDLLDGNNPSDHNTQEKVEFTLTFSADDVPEAIGNNLGIEFDNPADGYLGLDNVRLSLVN